ncbi:amino acid adenylation domain-containing protein [Nocardioides sp. GXZ039]|uniref:amino acid adenylation domain-containing protein n=1 Tax=Nocardioides sp. GXZ039 TaxID=3136018 RepID=UPI0030F4A3B3
MTAQTSVAPARTAAADFAVHLPAFDTARERPSAVALRQGATTLTYAELCGAAAALAHELVELGVGPEDRVAVCAARGPRLWVAVLGVLAAGAAYVPVLPEDPRRRRSEMLRDAAVKAAVVDDAGRGALAESAIPLVEAPSPVGHPALAPPTGRVLHPAQAAYVLFTSGSTGRPKGIVVGHGQLRHYASAIVDLTGIDAVDTAIGFASIGFDASVHDIFCPLLSGGSAVLLTEEERSEPALTQRALAAATWGWLPPAMLALLDPEALPGLRCLLVGGDTCPPDQVARWTADGRRLLNTYGPTETTVSVSAMDLRGAWETTVPIGSALAGHRLTVRDAEHRVLPDGEAGQLFASGPGVSRGYLGSAAATAAAFLPDPDAVEPGGRMYATGDLARRRPDGVIELLGRVDRQVKLGGLRIDLLEIETAVRAHPEIENAVVQVIPDPGGRPVVHAFCTPATGPDLTDLRRFLDDRLPGGVHPNRVHRMTVLPTLSAGKIDRSALCALAESEADPEAGDTGTSAGSTAAVVWREMLGPAAPDDDFLALGGTSLAAMRIAGGLRARLGVELSVRDVLTARTLRGLESHLDHDAPRPAAGAVLPVGTPAHLSPAQRRLWFLDRLTSGTPAYHIPLAYRLRGPIDVPGLAAALSSAARIHEALRWTVATVDGRPEVRVTEPHDVDLPVHEPYVDEHDWLETQARRPIDLETGPLWHAELLRIGAEEHLLSIVVHHIVFDGGSVGPLLDSVAAAYSGGTLAEPTVRYADHVRDQQHRREARRAGDTAWWLEQLATIPPVLDLPRDRARPAVQTFRGIQVRRAAPDSLADAVARAGLDLGVTRQSLLLTAFGLLLARLTGQYSLVVGIPVADRPHPDLDTLVGFFIDTVPVPMTLDPAADFATAARAVASTVLDAIEHRAIAFEDLVDGLGLPRDLGRSPLVQVLFNAFDVSAPTLGLAGVKVETVEPGLAGGLFDLTLYVDETDGLTFTVVANPDLYDHDRIAALLDSYLTLVTGLLERPGAPVGTLGARPADSPLPTPNGPLAAAEAREDGVVEQVLSAAPHAGDATVIRGTDREVTGSQLVESVRAIATSLREEAGPVGILAERDVDLPGLWLGALAAGRPPLVLDASQPGGWLATLAATAGIDRILVTPGTAVPPELADIASHGSPPEPRADPNRAIAPNGPTPDTTPSDPVGPFEPVEPHQRSYLLATSGTTAAPAIVSTPEARLADFLDWYTDEFDVGADDRTALLGGLGHDPMLRDCFAALARGGTLLVPPTEWLHDPDRLAAFLHDESASILHLTPQLARMLTTAKATLPQVRLIVLGGDVAVGRDVARLRVLCPRVRIVNAYGATETPQIHAWHPVDTVADDAMPVPVGRGRPGVALVVRTPGGRPAAVGELGEVVVASTHLAAGYLGEGASRGRLAGRPSGTSGTREDEAIEDATGTGPDGPTPQFETGDLGRYSPDGSVVIAGRTDTQVKIRGRRVDLAEVTAALRECPQVRDAAVTTHGTGDGLALTGYVVLDDTRNPDPVRRHLDQRLPDYARPADLVVLPALPRTARGKLDVAALPPPVPARRGRTDDLPSTPTERTVAGIWREVLGVPRVSIHDNFFDIGGHSLAIVEVQQRLVATLGQEVRVVDLFGFPTIADLARHLDGGSRAPGLDRASRRVAAQRTRRAANRRPRPRPATQPPSSSLPSPAQPEPKPEERS